MAQLFTLEQVSKHSNPKDCWIIISGKVKASLPSLNRPLSLSFLPSFR
jgi:hypothetical protein